MWRVDVGRVSLYLLDTDVDENEEADRRITDRLYGGDTEHRLRQEIVLGIGGMRALDRLGLTPTVLHLNEGHAAFAAVERVRGELREEAGGFRHAAERLADSVVFTTHTPVPAGHDHFPPDLLKRYLGGYVWEMGEPWDHFLALGRRHPDNAGDSFCMTTLALRLAHHRNGVSRLHGDVTREMWADLWPELSADRVPIGHVTNGVHLPTWTGEPIGRLYGAQIGEAWRDEVDDLRWQRALHIPDADLWRARCEQRAALVRHVRSTLAGEAVARGMDPNAAAAALDPHALTLVFARRFASYKRATLLLRDRVRLERLLHGEQPVQFVFAGKAHPRDEKGQELLHQVAEFALHGDHGGRFVFLQGYDVALARVLVAGADVWLNVPRRPYEASGTSGMKAAANGALNLSIADGWWAEAWSDHNRLADPIGWTIEEAPGPELEAQDAADAERLYAVLENDVLPLFYQRGGDGIPFAWLARVRASIRQVVPFFNTHRMVADYLDAAYVPAHLERPQHLPAEEARRGVR